MAETTNNTTAHEDGGLNKEAALAQNQKPPTAATTTGDASSAYGASTLAMTETEKGGHRSVGNGRIASGTQRPGNLVGTAIDTGLGSNTTAAKGLPPVYAAKAQLLNEALLDIGMGRYQWRLVVATAVGWFLCEFWLASYTVILPSASNEAMLYYTYQTPTDLMISAAAGLALGAVLWPVLSDAVGRKQPFTSTVVLAGMAGLVGAGMTAFTGLCVVGFILGFAIGGTYIVDAMYLLESLPPSHQWLVAAQGVFWGVGQVVAYAVGYAFIELYTCGTGPDTDSSASSSFSRRQHSGSGSSTSSSSSSSSSSTGSCHYVSNKGWRYTWWCFGCITLFLYLLRFALRTYETPKSLLARRRDAEAVQTTRDMAHANGQITWLNEAAFARADTSVITEEEDATADDDDNNDIESNGHPTGGRRRRATTTTSRSRTTGIITSLRSVVAQTGGPAGLANLLLLWASFGLTFLLQSQFVQPYVSAHHGVAVVDATTVSRTELFTHNIYVALCAVPGPLVAAFLAETPRLGGRRRAGALLSFLAGVLMLASGASATQGAVLAFACVLAFLQSALLAVLLLYTVEVFGAPVRGVGVAFTGLAWRGFQMIAWIVAGYGSSSSSTNGGAVWFAGALSIVVAAFWILLPRETRAVAAA